MEFNSLRQAAPALGLFLLSANAFATPAQIVIIRHAEKPASGDEVDQQGCERAYSLPPFFETNAIVNQFGTPVAIFAAQPDHAGSSLRPVETIAPTAQALGLEIQDPATKLNYPSVVQPIMSNPSYDGKTVLVSWEHDAIPGLAQAFGAVLSPDTQSWPGVVFDEAWVLNFTSPQALKKSAHVGGDTSGTADSVSVTLTIIPEDVMPGDNPLGGANWQNPPTAGGTVPTALANQCVNNGALDSLSSSLASPPVP